MHEIEDLVEGSIVVLDRHFPADDDRLPDWFAKLYEFQSGFDCSDTRGRVQEILIRRGATGRPRRVRCGCGRSWRAPMPRAWSFRTGIGLPTTTST